jgi:DNA-directed RNA polymerase beta subunit
MRVKLNSPITLPTLSARQRAAEAQRVERADQVAVRECRRDRLEPGLPESFKVLVKELLSLALEVQLFEDTQA